MKNFYIIGGTMGVGKTSVCGFMKDTLENSVFLDGDWCWTSHPFQITEETKKMVLQNICFLLNQFVHCSAYENIIFCWVMHEQNIIDSILEKLDTDGCNVKNISLVCSQKALEARLQKDIKAGIRSEDILEKSIARIPLYNNLKTIKINTDNKSVSDVAKEIIAL